MLYEVITVRWAADQVELGGLGRVVAFERDRLRAHADVEAVTGSYNFV